MIILIAPQIGTILCCLEPATRGGMLIPIFDDPRTDNVELEGDNVEFMTNLSEFFWPSVVHSCQHYSRKNKTSLEINVVYHWCNQESLFLKVLGFGWCKVESKLIELQEGMSDWQICEEEGVPVCEESYLNEAEKYFLLHTQTVDLSQQHHTLQTLRRQDSIRTRKNRPTGARSHAARSVWTPVTPPTPSNQRELRQTRGLLNHRQTILDSRCLVCSPRGSYHETTWQTNTE